MVRLTRDCPLALTLIVLAAISAPAEAAELAL